MKLPEDMCGTDVFSSPSGTLLVHLDVSTTSGGRTPEHFGLDDDNDEDRSVEQLDVEMCDGNAEVNGLSSVGVSTPNGGGDGIIAVDVSDGNRSGHANQAVRSLDS